MNGYGWTSGTDAPRARIAAALRALQQGSVDGRRDYLCTDSAPPPGVRMLGWLFAPQ